MGLRKTLLPLSLLSMTAVGAAFVSADESEARMLMEEPVFIGEMGGAFAVADFRLEGVPLGDTKAPTVLPHAASHGGTVAVDDRGVLTLDRDSGELVRADRQGRRLASLGFHSGAGELVLDEARERVFVADRAADRVAVVDVRGETLKVVTGAKVHEPHGLALSPDGKTLYVSAVADHELIALDVETMSPRWTLELAAEPRGVAVSPDGKQAVVGFLSTGALARVQLGGSSPSVNYLALDPAQPAGSEFAFNGGFGNQVMAMDGRGQVAAPSLADQKDVGRRFARNVFTVGFVGDGIIVAPHQLSTPHMASNGVENLGTYGGGEGFSPPILHRMVMVDGEDAFAPKMAFAQIGVHQPRAMAYDAGSDTLYLAGYGDDKVLAVAEVSRSSVHLAWAASLGTTGCGADGIAVDGDELFVHCELDRSLVRLDTSTVEKFGQPQVIAGPELAASARSEAAQRGAELFRRGMDSRMSSGGFMACASCHPEGRSDGLSWRIEGHNLQTPLLAGRVIGTHPFKWDGKDADLQTSLTNTIGRLGGAGLTPAQIGDLQAFLEGLPQPEAPRADDPDAIARGRKIFESDKTACAACHDGPSFADGVQHDFDTNIGDVDTPSLLGLAHTAPYYHDGSARTLRALLTDKASVHDMGRTEHLDDEQLDDLIAYLESL